MSSDKIQVRWEYLNNVTVLPESRLEPAQADILMRARVPGGWLIRQTFRVVDNDNLNVSVAITFYPDPKHQWDGWSIPSETVPAISDGNRATRTRQRSQSKRSSA